MKNYQSIWKKLLELFPCGSMFCFVAESLDHVSQCPIGDLTNVDATIQGYWAVQINISARKTSSPNLLFVIS